MKGLKLDVSPVGHVENRGFLVNQLINRMRRKVDCIYHHYIKVPKSSCVGHTMNLPVQ